MVIDMLQAIQPRINGRIVLVLFVLTNAVYFAMLTYSIPELMSVSDGLPIFDMSPYGYSYQQALAILSCLGEEGRSFYLSTQLVLDLFYPLLFGLCYSSLLQWLIKLIQDVMKFLSHSRSISEVVNSCMSTEVEFLGWCSCLCNESKLFD